MIRVALSDNRIVGVEFRHFFEGPLVDKIIRTDEKGVALPTPKVVQIPGPKTKRGTECKIFRLDPKESDEKGVITLLDRGVTYFNPEDNFSKEEGRRRSLERALCNHSLLIVEHIGIAKNRESDIRCGKCGAFPRHILPSAAKFEKPDRFAIWSAYWNRFPDQPVGWTKPEEVK